MWKGCVAVIIGMLPVAMSSSPWSLIQARTLVEGNHGTVSSMDEALVFVQSLADKVVGHDVPLTETEKKGVDTIQAYVKRMLEDIKKQRDEDQAEVYRYRAVVQGCADTAKQSLEGQVASLLAAANTARGNHANCRKDEATEATQTSAECQQYNAYRSAPPGNAPPACMNPLRSSDVSTTDAATKKSMEQCITAIHNWVVPLYDLYMKCKSKVDGHVGATQQCDNKQSEFENDFCQYAGSLSLTCSEQTKCRATNIGILREGDKEVEVAEKARAADCEVGHKVDCLLKIFEEEDNKKKPKMLEDCKKLVPSCPDKISYPDVPDPTPCSEEPNQPCDEKWLETEYSSQNWYALAPATWCHSCLPPHPCKVTLYEKKLFGGWNAAFPPGIFNTRALRRGGAQDDQVSAIQVEEKCLAVVYKNPDLTGDKGVFGAGKYDSTEFKKVFPDDMVSSLLVVGKLSFGLKGRYGDEEVLIEVGSQSKQLVLSTSWQRFDFDVTSDGQYTINFLNDGGHLTQVDGKSVNRDIFFRSDYRSTITLPPNNWNCGYSGADPRCQDADPDTLYWGGKYSITVG